MWPMLRSASLYGIATKALAEQDRTQEISTLDKKMTESEVILTNLHANSQLIFGS